MTRDRCDTDKRRKAADAAYHTGDLEALRGALGDPPDFPNSIQPWELALGDHVLEYAIYWSPISFIQQLLERGADPNYPDRMGFPSLIAALSSGRRDQHAILRLLIEAGADLDQRGLNDWTALHYAVTQRDLTGLRLLLDAGADPALPTRIDDCTSPLEDAEASAFHEAAELLRAALETGKSS